MLHEQIKNKIKEAMLAKDVVLLETLRSMVASFTNELISKNRKPTEFLTDEEVLAVITRLSKQRKDSIEQYRKGNREDLVKEEEAQLTILETYLPKLMNKNEIDIVYLGQHKFKGLKQPLKIFRVKKVIDKLIQKKKEKKLKRKRIFKFIKKLILKIILLLFLSAFI